MRRALTRLASAAPAPVFLARGAGAREVAEQVRLSPDVAVVDSPRHASVLMAIGCFPPSMLPPLQRVHDQLGHPRGVVLATSGDDGWLRPAFPRAVTVDVDGSAPQAAILLHQELLTGLRSTSESVLPDVDPAPWRGVGPYGHGGKGMTGGVPYGRPLTGLADDRDGLKLDQLSLRVGPFFPHFPPGLTLDVKLQGDVVQEASIGTNPFVDLPRRRVGTTRALFVRALEEPVSVRDLELARAAHHLRWFGDVLTLQGLSALGERSRRLAARAQTATPEEILGLRRLVERSRGLGWATRRVGSIPAAAVASRGLGPTARASGVEEDGRKGDPAYEALGFEPVMESHGDARARWRQRLGEAASSLALAQRAGDRTTGGRGSVESPWGLLSADHAPVTGLLEMLPSLLNGAEWGDAVTTIVSLDLDLEEGAGA